MCPLPPAAAAVSQLVPPTSAQYSPWECREMALPRSWLNSLVPMALRITTTSGAKGPPSPLLPATTVKLRRPAR
jgi:hypothetical protein